MSRPVNRWYIMSDGFIVERLKGDISAIVIAKAADWQAPLCKKAIRALVRAANKGGAS